MKILSYGVNNVVRKLLRDQHGLMPDIIANWKQIVGEQFYDKIFPMKINIYKEKGADICALYLHAENASIATTLMFQEGIIIERLSVILGCKIIKKLRIKIFQR